MNTTAKAAKCRHCDNELISRPVVGLCHEMVALDYEHEAALATTIDEREMDQAEAAHAAQSLEQLESVRAAAVAAVEALKDIDKATGVLIDRHASSDLDPSIYALTDIDAHLEAVRPHLRDIERAAELEQRKIRIHTHEEH